MSVVVESKRYCLECDLEGSVYVVLLDGKWYLLDEEYEVFEYIDAQMFNQLKNLYDVEFTSLFEKEPTLSQQYISELYKEGIVLSCELDLKLNDIPF